MGLDVVLLSVVKSMMSSSSSGAARPVRLPPRLRVLSFAALSSGHRIHGCRGANLFPDWRLRRGTVVHLSVYRLLFGDVLRAAECFPVSGFAVVFLLPCMLCCGMRIVCISGCAAGHFAHARWSKAGLESAARSRRQIDPL
jgi:hypothetical protein